MSRDVRVAPNIYRSRNGWRVYLFIDGKLKPRRFGPDVTLEQLQAFVAGFKAEYDEQKRQRRDDARALAGTINQDAKRYLQLAVVKAMPSYTDRAREIGMWVQAFDRRALHSLTAREIDEQLQIWRNAGHSPSSCNKYRAALMSLFTRLRGKGAANPVRDTQQFEEPEAQARGLPYTLVSSCSTPSRRSGAGPSKARKARATAAISHASASSSWRGPG